MLKIHIPALALTVDACVDVANNQLIATRCNARVVSEIAAETGRLICAAERLN